jgi:hypothetical protein
MAVRAVTAALPLLARPVLRFSGMANPKLASVLLALLPLGCGGADFNAAGTDVQADAGTGAGGTAGAQATGGGGTAAAGSVTSATGGDAGTGTGGAGGAAGGAGTGGGQPGTGGAPNTCKPPVVTDQNMPSTVAWKSYLNKYGTDCMECVSAPCTTCTLYWSPVTQSADGLTVTASINKSDCPGAPMKVGACDTIATNRYVCTTYSVGMTSTLTMHLEAKPDGTGYGVADLTISGAIGIGGGVLQICDSAMLASLQNPPLASAGVLADLKAVLMATSWACGQ